MLNKTLLTVGNPNSGKTTLFNQLTGANQAVGNWSGVTVEKKTGMTQIAGFCCQITDLPGIYSFEQNFDTSQDETIALNALFNLPSDLIINIVDASTLERSLYLTLQLRELGRPMLVVLNKMDLCHELGYQIDTNLLSSMLGCPVIDVTAKSNESMALFKQNLANHLADFCEQKSFKLEYDKEVENTLEKLEKITNIQTFTRSSLIRVLNKDQLIISMFSNEIKEKVFDLIDNLNSKIDVDLTIADTRYSKVVDIYHSCHKKIKPLSLKITDKIDDIVLHKYFGIPIFFAVMYLMFMFAINIGGAFIDFFDIATGAILVDSVHYLLDDNLPIWFVTILADGFGAGIQTVSTFIPVIAGLYLFMSLLESSGYMARAAFVLDKGMQKIGLPGKAFVPLVLGFGCNVPAIMATRTLEKDRERKLAASMAPFMSCGARLPVYALFAAAFFPENGQNAVFFLYLLGIAVAIFTGIVFKKTIFPGESESLIMEMPKYELPRAKDIVLKTWNKLKRFVFGAGKTIVLVITILSFLNSIGVDGSFGNQDSENSVLSKAAQWVTPALSVIGIEDDNWQATVGIITGIFAKEAVVGTLNSLYSLNTTAEETQFSLIHSLEEAVLSIPNNLLALNFSDPLGIQVGNLSESEAVASEQGVDLNIFRDLTEHFTIASAFAYLVFVLLYTPCVAALGAYVREFGRPFAFFIASWTMLLAVIVSTICYQAMMLTITPVVSSLWIVSALMILALIIALLYRFSKKNELQFSGATL